MLTRFSHVDLLPYIYRQFTLLIDNYDSFTHNLYQFLEQMGAHVRVVRNDQITLEEIQVSFISISCIGYMSNEQRTSSIYPYISLGQGWRRGGAIVDFFELDLSS